MEPSNPKLTGNYPLGVLVCNLGTPAAPTADAVRLYLREFLTDPKVVQPPPPRWVWRIILETIILPSRPRRVAEKYAAIWTPEGSPLLVNSRRIAAALERKLIHELGPPLSVELAMRYGEPSINRALDMLQSRGCERLVILPLFPHPTSATTESLAEAVFDSIRRRDWKPRAAVIRNYSIDARYMDAIMASIREHWQARGVPGHLLVSFHGIPRRYRDAGRYEGSCRQTVAWMTDTIVDELGAKAPRVQMCFQSRFGREEWLRPYFSDLLQGLARMHARVDVISPGFAADCLETLHELAIEGRELFQSTGGREYDYISALNDRPDHITALAEVVKRRLESDVWDLWKYSS